MRTKNLHGYMNEPDFRDYPRLLDEQAERIFAMTDDVGERARQIGGVPSAPLAKYRNSNASRTKNEEPVAPNEDE